MPNRTIYVRDDDLEAFDAIVDRPTWVHIAIRTAGALVKQTTVRTNIDTSGLVRSAVVKIPFTPKPKDPGTITPAMKATNDEPTHIPAEELP